MGHACSSERTHRESHEYDVFNLSLAIHNQKLSYLNLFIRPIKAGANSLYRAIADQLEGTDQQYLKYKDLIIKYMKEHEQLYAPKISSKYQTYLHQLNKESVTPGANEIDALCNALNLNTIIYTLNETTMVSRPGLANASSKVIQL